MDRCSESEGHSIREEAIMILISCDSCGKNITYAGLANEFMIVIKPVRRHPSSPSVEGDDTMLEGKARHFCHLGCLTKWCKDATA